MADRDNYRGYGSPSGRYYENREYEPGRGRDDDRSRSFGRDREDMRGGNDRDRDRDDNGGFFERAGSEIRSWFSDDDDRGRDRHTDRDEPRGQQRPRNQDRDRGYGYGSMLSGQGGRRPDYPQTTRGEDRYQPGGSEAGGSRYGATSGSGMGSAQNQYGGGRSEDRGGQGGMGGGDYRGRGSHPQDEHYSEWRNRQVAELDRDYDEYRRENRDKFHSEFSNWRGQRQQQRQSLGQVREHMEVVGSDGEAVGTVDKVARDKIILTKSGPMAGGHHHSIPCSWIQSVDERVTISKTAEQAREKWTDEETRRALFESDDQRRDDGPHILDRSFSGTYGS